MKMSFLPFLQDLDQVYTNKEKNAPLKIKFQQIMKYYFETEFLFYFSKILSSCAKLIFVFAFLLLFIYKNIPYFLLYNDVIIFLQLNYRIRVLKVFLNLPSFVYCVCKGNFVNIN